MHNPNPFDFVPFAASGPLLRTPDEYEALSKLRLSGYLEVKIKALTPVHIVGYQQGGESVGQSFFYSQNNQPCIPAASIRGCLRAFIEALTSGWVSQANLEYPKEYQEHHVGFSAFKTNPKFEPQTRQDKKIDVAAYLFGRVIEPKNDAQKNHKDLARKSKIWIEDAFIDKMHIVDNKYWIPDIGGDAFMGGAKPSASNWWYLQPREIWQRDSPGGKTAEFIGDKFWGRKFYFHQDPLKCVKYYDPATQNWSYRKKSPFYRVQLECLEQDVITDSFRIYFDKVPEPLVTLFVLCLLPGKNIRHKLGYGKAFGYGSIEFSLEAARLRNDNAKSRIPAPLTDLTNVIRGLSEHAWDKAKLKTSNLDETLIDWEALEHLARVLGWQDYDKLLFTYPPFKEGYFATPVKFKEFISNVPAGVTTTPPVSVTSDQAWQIAEKLFNKKKPLHFHYYQENAEGWSIISDRKP
ncbi:MAG: hypothetical protein BroJett011_18900 [Chloroflexota bacterium]|nr:MAG: hypothetical protein BroJett011_18900 [Chloroflexota bacterium]